MSGRLDIDNNKKMKLFTTASFQNKSAISRRFMRTAHKNSSLTENAVNGMIK